MLPRLWRSLRPVTPLHRLRNLAILATVFALFSTHPAQAQEQPEPDPVNGAAIFAARCANCHGPLGLGDGELAPSLPNPPTAIANPEFLAANDSFSIAQTIWNGRVENGMPGFGEGNNSNPLTEQEVFDVVAALSVLPVMNEPIPAARIIGQVGNGTVGELFDGGTITLEAFTPEFELGGTFTTDIQADGSYLFDLSDLPPNWFYRTFVTYSGLDFASNVGRLTPFETETTLNVIVFEPTTDDKGIRVWQHQTLVDFGPETVQVAEIYLFSNTEPTVYIGDSLESGTVQIPVPAGAENVIFLQGFGDASNFAPIEEPTVIDNVWRPKLDILPGEGTLQLLMRYVLPYEPGMTISHPLPYPTDFIELAIPDTGATISTETNWRPEETTDGLDGQIDVRLRFSQPPLPPDSTWTFTITGFPSIVLDEEGNRIQQRDEVSETLIGMVVLVIVAAIVALTGYSWTQQQPVESDREALLKRIAALDLAYQEKTLSKRIWSQKRQELLNQLKSIWS